MAEESAEVMPLPPMPRSQRGSSSTRGKGFTATVSNASGYLCHIVAEILLPDLPPRELFNLFTHPDNAGAFRDVKGVGYRRVLDASDPGLKTVEVEQLGELRVLWINRTFSTFLTVTEDQRTPDCLRTSFELLRSDLLARFQGQWELRPLPNGGCRATLTQDVLPKGVPPFFAQLPLLGGLLRRVSLGTISRLAEDIQAVASRYSAAGGNSSINDIISEMAVERGHDTQLAENRSGAHIARDGTPQRSNCANSGVTSFAIEHSSDSEHDDSEGGEEVVDSVLSSTRAASADDGVLATVLAAGVGVKMHPGGTF